MATCGLAQDGDARTQHDASQPEDASQRILAIIEELQTVVEEHWDVLSARTKKQVTTTLREMLNLVDESAHE